MAQRAQHDHEAERNYLACCLTDPGVLTRAPVAPEVFTSVQHRTLYLAMREVNERGELDAVSLRSHLIDSGSLDSVGGEAGLLDMANVIPIAALIDRYRERLVMLHRERTLAVALAEASGLARAGRVDEAAERTRTALEESQAAAPGWLSERWHPIGADWLRVEPRPQEWLLTREGLPVLASGIVGMLVAPGGRGKSVSLVALALAVATGRQWLGTFDVARPGRVAVLMGEEDEAELRRRIFRTARALELDDRAAHRAATRITAIGLAGRDVRIVAREGDEIARTQFLADLCARVADHELVIIDPLSRFAPDVEGDNAHATAAITALEHVAQSAGGTVLVAHHTAKWSRREGSKSGAAGARGVSALTDGVRWVASLTGTSEDDIELSVDKSNRAAAGDPVRLTRTPEGVLVPRTGEDPEADASWKREQAYVSEMAERIVRALLTARGEVIGVSGVQALLGGANRQRVTRAIDALRANGRITGGGRNTPIRVVSAGSEGVS